MKAKTFIALAALLGAFAPAEAAREFIPVISGMFSTGQWYFDGDRSSLGGNVNLTVVPALRFTNSFSLIPTVETSYRGTRSAEELAGGSTLFQDTWENAVGIKAVHALGEKWKIRERAGYRIKWFRETSDETWTDGLYDYNVATVGGEVEHLFTPKTTLALGYDFSLLEFPNYESLESAQGNELSREFSGSDVLDTRIHLFSARSSFPLPARLEGSVQIFYSPRDYDSQHEVLASGLFSQGLRHDTYTGSNVTLERMFPVNKKSRILSTLYYGYSAMNSNQNHYDARLTTFIGDYYDYGQNRVGLQLSLAVGLANSLPMVFDVGGSYSKRDYSDRIIQNLDGSYGNEKLYLEETSVNLGYSYPLSKNFRMKVTSTFGRSKSNNDYEAVYRYNYSNSNYQFGFTYDY